jgi:putative PIN family toxin of toxin-antitoxin system
VISATLDTNIYVSALEFRGAGSRLFSMARAGIIRIDTSDAILDETISVLRDKFHWEGYRLHFARLELLRLTNFVKPERTLAVADDPDDDRILECAVTAASDYIVTHDDDLLRLREYSGIKIVKVADFLLRGIER